MARGRADRRSSLAFDAITVEGALISPAMLARIAQHQADGQTDTDYGIPKGLTLRNEIARYFRIGQALLKESTVTDTPSTAATVNFIEKLLHDMFGFAEIRRVGTRTVGDRRFTITLECLGGRVPVVVVPPADDIDRPCRHLTTDGRRRSAASALQDWLNAGETALWGLCTNGIRVRLARGNSSLTRPAYIEADLRRIFESDAFADFAALWLLVHSSRFGIAGTLPVDCALERWRDAGQKEGVTARDKLRDGVEAALLSLGNGFMSHPNNSALREKLYSGALPLPEFFSQLLRLVYRLIFLLAAEDRNLLHPPDTAAGPRRLYAEGYSLGTLRDRAVRRAAWDRHHDRWEGLLVTFVALARGEKRLGLPALGGLFAPDVITNLEGTRLANRNLMEAIFRLAWLREPSGLVPVNWRDMETEELGSVYESLLELTPQLTDKGHGFAFAMGVEAMGHARKSSGSYYTPDSLVQALLDSALDPVLDRAEAEAEDPTAKLLSVTVLDPACGSGHFLLAAARRIATRVARSRTGGVASPADYRHALRDVVRSCIHGVDRNPMAVELTKVALWIETVEPGKPLGFLDGNIRCGDSLLGVFNLKALVQGIPDAAYKPLAGDDKEAAKIASRINREQRESVAQHDLAAAQGAVHFVRAARAIAAMPEDDLAGVHARARAYEAVHAEHGWWATNTACDLYVAAFLAPKHFRSGGLARAQTPDRIPTTLDVRTALAGRQPDPQLVALAVQLTGSARAFHWPLEFPAVMATGGFDVVLGNPPWDRIKLQEQEFFAARDIEIAAAPTAAARGRMIAALQRAEPTSRQRMLFEEFAMAKRASEAISIFARESGRFPLTGRGDVNTYALFAEVFADSASPRGRAGIIVPTGIATDTTTSPFFDALLNQRRLLSLHDFQTGLGFFDRIGHARFKFCLLTIGATGLGPDEPEFSFFSRTMAEFADPRRHFRLSRDAIACVNPNTITAPIFRTSTDAELASAIHRRVPVLINEVSGTQSNPWAAFYLRLIHYGDHSEELYDRSRCHNEGFVQEGNIWSKDTCILLPVYESKYVSTYDHRYATVLNGDDIAPLSHDDSDVEITPRYWVRSEFFESLLDKYKFPTKWFLSYRDIARSTDARTVIATAIPRVPASVNLPILGFDAKRPGWLLLANMNSIVLDYVARQSVSGTHLNFSTVKQLPLFQEHFYSISDRSFIKARVLELTYTSHSMASFALDLGYVGPPFPWDDDRRAILRAELDAWYARAYGLTRDELRYILDPADVNGPDYPSETFRVLKTNEIRRFGEYRTARLVLQAWDRMERGELAA